MNKFDEINQIKTPQPWIDEIITGNHVPSNKNKIIKIKYVLTILLLIITIGVSSLGFTYAISESFRTWLDECFGENMKVTLEKELGHKNDSGNIELSNDRWYTENSFIGIVNEEYNYTKVYVLENKKLLECPILEYQGVLNDHEYSFNYARYQDRIIGFNYSGCITKIMPKIINNEIFVCVNIQNGEILESDIAKINIDTNEVTFITNDHISINPIASPQQTNILINKSDQRWENYNVESGTTNLVTNIDPYSHSNTITFVDERTIITYDETQEKIIDNVIYGESQGILVDVLDDRFTLLEGFPLEGTAVEVIQNKEQTKLVNLMTGVEYTTDNLYQQGTVSSLDYIIFFDQDNLKVYDINNNRLFNLNSHKGEDEKLRDIKIINQYYLLVTTNKRIYIVANESNKDETEA